MHGGGSAPSCCAFIHRVAFKEVSGYLNGLGRLPAKTLKPEVRLVKLPFFNMLDELLKPTELVESLPHPRVAPPPRFSRHPRPTKWPIRSIFWGRIKS